MFFCYKRLPIPNPLPVQPSSPKPHSRSAFTLMEMLVVIGIIAIVLAFLVPALSPSSARALEGDSRNFAAQLDNARMMALAKRTKTRVLIAATNDWGTDFSWRAYVLASFDIQRATGFNRVNFFGCRHRAPSIPPQALSQLGVR